MAETKGYVTNLGDVYRDQDGIKHYRNTVGATKLDDGSLTVGDQQYYPILPENSVARQLLTGSALATVNKMINSGAFDSAVQFRLDRLIASGDPKTMDTLAYFAHKIMSHPLMQRALLEMKGVEE